MDKSALNSTTLRAGANLVLTILVLCGVSLSDAEKDSTVAAVVAVGSGVSALVSFFFLVKGRVKANPNLHWFGKKLS